MNGEKRFRELNIERKAVDEESRTVELAFSSEEPYERSFGLEILDHDQESADFSRLHSGAPLLVNHDPDDQIGVVESARIDDDRIGRAVVRFGKSQRAQEIFGDVAEGIRRLVSVGYYVKQVEKMKRGDDELVTYRVNSWQPLEISLVAVPADPTVGVGRSVEPEDSKTTETKTSNEEIIMNEESTLTVDASPSIQVDESAIRKQEAKRSKELVALGAKYDCIDEAQRAIESGKNAGQFSQWILDNNLKTEPATEVRNDDGDIGLNEEEKESYSLTRAINGFVNTGQFSGLEHEASEAAKKRYGRNVDGLVIPTDVLNHASKRALSAGTATAGGNSVSTDLLGASFIDLLRNASVIAQTGATYLNGLQGDVAIPRQSGAATAYWLTEVAAVTDSAQTMDQVTMTPKGLSAQTTYSKQLLAQSSLDVEQFIRNDLASILAIAQDLAAVQGTGSSGQPTGIFNTSGIGSVTATSSLFTDVVNMEKEVAIDNALNGNLAYVSNATFGAKAKRTEIAANTAKFVLADGQINGRPFYTSNQMPSTYASNAKSAVIFGNWSDLLIGNWSGIDVVVDPFSAAGTRQVKIVTSMFTDIAVRHPQSFCKAELTH